MTDFGITGKLIDFFRDKFEDRDEKKLRERFVNLVRSLSMKGGNTYTPAFGSDEYWEAEKMADRGWFKRLPPFGYMIPRFFNGGSLG